MAWKLTVAGVDKTALVMQPSNPNITLSLNNRGNARFTFLSGFIPNKYDDVVIYAQDGVTKIFGGLVIKRDEQPLGGSEPLATVSVCAVECIDYQVYGDWCYTSRSYASDTTLKQVLTDLVTDALGTFGITLDAGQVTGPTIPAFSFSNTKVSDAWRQLFTDTGYVLRIDANKAMKMFIPGTDAAPFTTTDATPHVTALTWADTDFISSNTVLLQVGTSGNYDAIRSDSVTADGVKSSWDFAVATPVDPTGILPTHYPYTLDGGGSSIHVGGVIKHWGTDFTWVPNPSAYTTTLALVPATPPAAGTVIDFIRAIAFPFTVIATTGASPQRTVLASDPALLTIEAAQAEVNQMLLQLGGDPRVISAKSLNVGWLPGQLWTVNISSRGGLNTNWSLGDVQITLVTNSFWVYSFQATEQTKYQGNSIDKWRALLGGSSITGGLPTQTTPPSLSPGGINKDVQFNDGGTFGGTDQFTFDKTTHSVVMGLNSNITAAAPESCFVFGDDCHVTD